jgi:hypothetical protein
MERPVIILRFTLTRCCRLRTMATDWASALQSIPGRSIIRPACTPHIAHTDIGHTRIGTVSTVHIITIGARQPLHPYYAMLKGHVSLFPLGLPSSTKTPLGHPENSLVRRWDAP